MTISSIYSKQQAIALTEFTDIVFKAQILSLPTGDPLKLRLDLVDGSLIDVFVSLRGHYSYHWERRLIGKGDLYRHDNAPHARWSHISTFPKHFHDGSQHHVVASHISDDPEEAIREFLTFVRHKLSTP